MHTKKTIDWVKSNLIADIIDARLSECVANVTRAFLDFRHILPKNAFYVEGLYWYGGQLFLHTWIETANHIIDPTIIREMNDELRETIRHYKILRRTESEIHRVYGSVDRAPGHRLNMKLTHNNPKVVKLEQALEMPPNCKF
jgi:hypothetical protein